MNKHILITLSALLLGLPLWAKPVDPAAARRMAENLLHRPLVDATPASFSECYLFVGADGKGFVLVAADDCVHPLLGYSPSEPFAVDHMPAHIADWLTCYQQQIAACRQAGTAPTAAISQEWQQLASGKYSSARDTAVGPLLTTRWNQSPYYNALCPYSTADSAYSVTGCVATATAQMMKYWNHPAVGRGSHSYTPEGFAPCSVNYDSAHYAWALMPDRLNGASSEAEVLAVAELMYHIGVAVNMNYSPQTSGAFTSSGGDPSYICSENALKQHFRYNQAAFGAFKVDYTDAEWDRLLSADLDASRPILISGSDGHGGHAFVVDGYDSLGLFHVNWGWGGYCDGFYTLDSLNPDGSGIGGNATNGYNFNVDALLHMFPASEDSMVTVTALPADPLRGSVSGSGTYPPYTSVTLRATPAEGFLFQGWTSGCHYNPIRFAPNNNYTDTALFGPMGIDTLAYCSGGSPQHWGEYNGNACEWGIRIPASAFAGRRQLEHVQLYGWQETPYIIRVYRGTTPDRLVYTATKTFAHLGWNTFSPDSPIPLDGDEPLWIVALCTRYSNPAFGSTYTGNTDGSWYKRGGTTWAHLEDRGVYLTWMIRALLGDLQPVQVTVTSSNDNYGTVSGSGSYLPGDTAILTATPAEGYRFAGWSTGNTENPLHLCVTEATTIMASFLPKVGIGDTENATLAIERTGLTLTIHNPRNQELSLYDISGRLLATLRSPLSTLALPAAGVYLLQAPGSDPIHIIATH